MMLKYLFKFKYIIVALLISLFVSSCKKTKAFNQESGQDLVDLSLIRTNNDLVLAEVNDVISAQFFLRGKSAESSGAASEFSTCAYAVDTTQIYLGKLIFTYSKNACENLKREGKIQISIQNYPTKKWGDKGAVLKIEFINYISTDLKDNQSIKFDGIEYITNESGGTWYNLRFLNQSSLVQTISGTELKITFDKTDFVYYNVGRRISYTFKSNVITGSSDGILVVNNLSNVDCWGTNRAEKNYTSIIESAIVWNTKCSALKPVAGATKLKVDDKFFDLNGLFGTNAEGATMDANDCAYGWKVSWNLRKKTKNRVFSY